MLARVGWWEVRGFSMAMSVLGSREPLVDIVRPISVFGINGLRYQPSHLVGPHFQRSSSYTRLALPKRLD